MRLRVRLFGSVEIAGGEGPLAVGYARGQLLLAWLLLNPGPWTRDALSELLWPEEAPGVARRRLREVVYRLRRALGDDERVEPLVVADRSRIELRPGADLTCDALRFDALIEAARTHEHRSTASCLPCLERLRQADARVVGPLLAGLELPAGEAAEGIERHRERRREDHTWGLLQLGRRSLDEGRWTEALQLAGRLMDVSPGHEPGLRLQMRALIGQGRTAEAAQAYVSFAERLQAMDRPAPDDETEELYQSLVHHEVEPAPESSPVRVPAPVGPLIGRDEDLHWVLERLASPHVRLITLVGMGGIGKTRLAIEAARRAAHTFRDGAWFVSAVDGRTPEDLVLAIWSALGLEGSGADPMRELVAWLDGREVLWVLDNLESVSGASEPLDALLRSATGLRILATSRVRLGLRAEHRRVVTGLGPAEAAALWQARVEQLAPEHPSEQEDVDAICAVLGGLPLAIEFAAARTLDEPTAAIVHSLRDGLDLKTAWIDVPERQESLRRILEDSVASLSPETLDALGRVSVFRGPFQPDAAREVCGVDAQVLDRLVARSLLAPAPRDRLALHPVVAAFAKERRGASDDLDAAHRRWFLGEPRCPDDEAHLELDDIGRAWRSAWQSGDLELLADRVVGLHLRFRDLGWRHQAARWFAESAAALDPETAAGRRVLACAGISAYRVGAGERALDQLVRAVELARRAGDVDDELRAGWWLGFVQRNSGDPEASVAGLRRVLDLAERVRPGRALEFRYGYATALYETGDLEGARVELERTAAEHTAPDKAAAAEGVLGLCEVLLGDQAGLDRLARAVRTLRPFDNSYLHDTLNTWACANLIAGRYAEARHRARAAREGYREQQFVSGIASTSAWLAIAEVALEGPDADRAVGEALEACGRTGNIRGELEAACVLAWWLPAEVAGDLVTTVQHHGIAELDAIVAPLVERVGPGRVLGQDELRSTRIRHAR